MKTGICIAVFSGFFISSLFAEKVITETVERLAESSRLSGEKVEAGEITWEATDNLLAVKNEGGMALGLTNTNGFMARLPIKEGASNVTVEAEVRSISAGVGDPWVAVGIGGGDLLPGSPNVNWAKGVFLAVTAAGRYQCLYNPGRMGVQSVIQILGGDVEGYVAGEFIALRLEYNSASNTLNMWINGVHRLKNFKLADTGFTPDISFGGVSGYGQTPDTAVFDNFAISYDE